jgi:hypothetical protein
MSAADAGMPHNSMKSRTRLRRLLLTAAAILGVWFVFVTVGPPVARDFTRQTALPALASAEPRSFPVAGGAPATNVLSVPSTALFTDPNSALQVDVWSGGRAYATTVTVGLVGKNLTQITSGVQAGEQVVLSPAGQSSLPTSPAPSPT